MRSRSDGRGKGENSGSSVGYHVARPAVGLPPSPSVLPSFAAVSFIYLAGERRQNMQGVRRGDIVGYISASANAKRCTRAWQVNGKGRRYIRVNGNRSLFRLHLGPPWHELIQIRRD